MSRQGLSFGSDGSLTRLGIKGGYLFSQDGEFITNY